MIIRNERDLVALQSFKFAGRRLETGEPFKATSAHARVLIALGRAAETAAPVVVGLPQNPYVPTAPMAPPAAPPAAPPVPAAAEVSLAAAEPTVSVKPAELPVQEASQAVAEPEVAAAPAEPASAAVGAAEMPVADQATASRARRARASTQA